MHRHESGRSYAAYQERVTEQHLLPLFRRLRVPLDRPILDVGCNKGGCAVALALALDVPVHGVDITREDLEVARALAADVGATNTRFDPLDVTRDPLPDRRYGLLLLRDVVEHLSDVGTALARLHELIEPDGFLYVTFPPWRGPYAGHQHNAKSAVKFMPWLHALSPGTFLSLLQRWEGDREGWLADERQICANHLTRKAFETLLDRHDWEIRYRETYFSRPAFLRMGLPTLRNGALGRIPGVGEVVTTACEYLLAPRR
jgi:SAM-dependent methyltransferase